MAAKLDYMPNWLKMIEAYNYISLLETKWKIQIEHSTSADTAMLRAWEEKYRPRSKEIAAAFQVLANGVGVGPEPHVTRSTSVSCVSRSKGSYNSLLLLAEMVSNLCYHNFLFIIR